MKPIKCPKLLRGCGNNCIEVKQLGYPKEMYQEKYKRSYYEHRYVCSKCGKEWLYESRPDQKQTSRIPKSSQYICKSFNGKILCKLNPKNEYYKMTLKFEERVKYKTPLDLIRT